MQWKPEAIARVAETLNNDHFLNELNEFEWNQPAILLNYLPREKAYSEEETAVLVVLANEYGREENSPRDKYTIMCAMAEIIDRRAA